LQYKLILSQIIPQLKYYAIFRFFSSDKDWLKKGKFALRTFPPVSLPLDPRYKVIGINESEVHIFKSAMAPLKLDFITTEKTKYSVIFKLGDDLRQDQFVLQLISLMDNILKKENLDLKLRPYRVLATSWDAGLLELVPNSMNIADVLKNNGNDIKKFFRGTNACETGPLGIDPTIFQNFVKSCAGYCVITYILGIGDRHLDNLLIDVKNGNLFHIDFGFILGRDPKPFPPPMKLCSEMVEGMGGPNSEYYNQFKQYCCEAYNILRKNANLILNLFSLMTDANIADINQGEKSIWKVQEKFKTELSDEDASQMFQSLINESVRAMAPVLAEAVHRWKKYWMA